MSDETHDESALDRAISGEELRVDAGAIEKSLAELWRNEKDGDHAVTRAALWNVVAHTASHEHHTNASETLGRASAAVPQRSIVIRSIPHDKPEMTSWISANCHLFDTKKQVCSEEIAIVAGGDRVHRVPPLVRALLIPDMPVAVWWLGDVPNEHAAYVEALLEPADRLIIDSVHFDNAADLALVNRVAEKTTTAPADLNWMRLEEWRMAAAAIFDPPEMRNRLSMMRRVRIGAGTSDGDFFGQSVESLFFAAWLSAQTNQHVELDGHVEGPAGAIDYRFERRLQSIDVGGVAFVEIQFDDGSCASIRRDRERGILKSNVDGVETSLESVTRTLARDTSDLIVRQLKRPESDRLFGKVLPAAVRMAKRIG